MHGLAALTLLLVPLVNGLPQGTGVVICDSTAVTDFQYDTAGTKDVTEDFGDKGWFNYNAKTCTSNKEACQSGEETSVTKEVSVDFAGNVAFDLAKAVEAGLDFGVSVAYSTTKTESTAEPCPGTDDPRGCICGLQYQEFKQEAWGTRHSSNACGDKVSEDFDVTAPIKIDDSAEVQWRSCRSKRSECKDIENMPLCADGL
ncbi:MAG: hypothetical protein HETSPECPRED_005102 [Heterodermia speciosa]|uniref:Uncharacterized protein n=1 Tax=Heterodermia speciosa TaxID=116794 RepID=A0A8H3IQV0_9LECA|nr:MAG: hypothetical protein HETSPECPRED_005102 [Heterodermia speciosa]